MDIKKITKDTNPGFFYFSFFVRCVFVGGGGGGRQGRAGQGSAGQGKGRCWQVSGSNYFHM